LVSFVIRRLCQIPIQGNLLSSFSSIPFSHVYARSLFCFWFVPEGDIRSGGYRSKVVP
jgi:hypothetical protein